MDTPTPQTSTQPPASGETPEQWKPRIWCFRVPFTKAGYPNFGSFGSTVRPVVIVPLSTWQRLCAENPALASTQFEVGTNE